MSFNDVKWDFVQIYLMLLLLDRRHSYSPGLVRAPEYVGGTTVWWPEKASLHSPGVD